MNPVADVTPSGTRNAEGQAGTRSVGAVVQAICILRHLAAQEAPSGVTAVARATGLNTSTCFNILRTLAAEGLVVFNTEAKTYCLGFGILELSTSLLGASPVDLIRPELERLAHGRPVVVCLWHVTQNDRVVLADRVCDPTTMVRVEMAPDIRLPSFAAAVGRCVAAAWRVPDAELRRRFDGLRWQNPPSFEAYLADVRRAEGEGYALDLGQMFVGLDTAAAVIADHRGHPRFGISAISIHGQMGRADLEALGRELRDVARRIGAALFPR